MDEILILFPAEVNNGCPVIDEPGININAIIQIVIAGVLIWLVLSRR